MQHTEGVLSTPFVTPAIQVTLLHFERLSGPIRRSSRTQSHEGISIGSVYRLSIEVAGQKRKVSVEKNRTPCGYSVFWQ